MIGYICPRNSPNNFLVEREKYKGESHIKGYHTQECRISGVLEEAKPCRRTDAWLGFGFYFWTELEFAHYWGIDSKMQNTGSYDIYDALIPEENILNTVFNEEHYLFFFAKVEHAIQHFKDLHVRKKEILSKVNRYLTDNVWSKVGITGILFEDIPQNNTFRTYSEIPPLYYKKRIQLVVFDKKNIRRFAMLLEEQN
jgi:hypothetical protein